MSYVLLHIRTSEPLSLSVQQASDGKDQAMRNRSRSFPDFFYISFWFLAFHEENSLVMLLTCIQVLCPCKHLYFVSKIFIERVAWHTILKGFIMKHHDDVPWFCEVICSPLSLKASLLEYLKKDVHQHMILRVHDATDLGPEQNCSPLSLQGFLQGWDSAFKGEHDMYAHAHAHTGR